MSAEKDMHRIRSANGVCVCVCVDLALCVCMSARSPGERQSAEWFKPGVASLHLSLFKTKTKYGFIVILN